MGTGRRGRWTDLQLNGAPLAVGSCPSSLKAQLTLQTLRLMCTPWPSSRQFPRHSQTPSQLFFKKNTFTPLPLPPQTPHTSPDYRSSPWRLHTLPRGGIDRRHPRSSDTMSGSTYMKRRTEISQAVFLSIYCLVLKQQSFPRIELVFLYLYFSSLQTAV